MPPQEEDFSLQENAVIQQADMEAGCAQTAARLADTLNALLRIADPDLMPQYRKALDTAERLTRYCRGMTQAMDDAQLEMHQADGKIQAALDEAYYEIRRFTAQIE